MKNSIQDGEFNNLLEATYRTALRTAVSTIVGRHFKSVHYKSSALVCDGVCMNILLNKKAISPTSADEILTYIRRENKAFYSNTEKVYDSIRDGFDEYARAVLKDDYNKIIALDLRAVNYIVYVISRDICENYNVNTDEIYMRAFSYEQIIQAAEKSRTT